MSANVLVTMHRKGACMMFVGRYPRLKRHVEALPKPTNRIATGYSSPFTSYIYNK